MTWTPERVAVALILTAAGLGALLHLAGERERRRGTGQRCDFCSFTGTRRDRCRCAERCMSPRCRPQRETGRAA